MSSDYRPRIADRMLTEMVEDFPVISILGPRASGKTTTAIRHTRGILRLDEPGTAAVVQANPDAAIRDQPEPLLIDEWQEAPAVLGAIKRTVDTDPRPGRFILTGSVRAELETQTWPGTGRVVYLQLPVLSVREQVGDAAAEPVIDRMARSGPGELSAPARPMDLRDYLRLALTGGFPQAALRLRERARPTWYNGYLQQVISRDAAKIGHVRSPQLIRKFLEVVALNTAGVVEKRTLYEGAGINRETADAYERLLQSLFLLDVVPIWFTNRLKRLIKNPKRYLVDAGLAASACVVDEASILRNSDLLGRLLDTFVAAQLRAELAVSRRRPRMYHVRTEGGRREVDLLLELSGGEVLGFEIKAAASVGLDSARHLVWLRDELGDRFLHGFVLHTGPGLFELGHRISAAPISSLWI
jgi:predicted AAA+ superfamily ATPase